MEKVCEKCGTVMDSHVKFCTECGAKVESIKVEPNQPRPQQQCAPAPQPRPQQQCGPAPQPRPQQPRPQQPRPQQPNQDKTTKVVGMAAYFGMILLFAIPLVGFIACILMAVLPKNKNVKNFSRAMLIWLAIGIIFSGISVAVISKKVIDTANKVTQYIKTIDTVSDVLNEVSGLLNQDGSGEIEESLEQFGIGELGDTLEQFDNGELEDTLEQLENGEWEEIFNQLENGGMEDILNSFGSGEFILE